LKILELLDELDEIIDSANTIPLTGKVLMDRNELMEIVKEARIVLPDEVKQAKWIKEERAKILDDAAEEASRIVKNAQREIDTMMEETRNEASKLVERNEITERARIRAEEILKETNDRAFEIQTGAYYYADDLLERFENNVDKMLDTVRRNRQELQRYKKD
jgi:vacuolar-type H+-ATPase subunit H